jgi:hypothetical protein
VSAQIVTVGESRIIVTLAEPLVNKEVTCSAEVVITDIEGRTRSCTTQVALAKCELDCDSSDIRDLLFALDGNSELQESIAKSAIAALRNITSNKKIAATNLAEVQKLHLDNWALTWSLPQVVNTCANTVLCASVSTSPTVQAFQVNAKKSFRLATKLTNRIENLGGKAIASGIRKRARAAYRKSISLTSRVPQFSSVCGGI